MMLMTTKFFKCLLTELIPPSGSTMRRGGKEAIELLKSYKDGFPDFIFLDLNMHIMNGVECLTELKKQPHISEIPVIIYSTTLNEQIKYHTLELGAFDHIEKPNQPADLDFYLRRIFQVEELA